MGIRPRMSKKRKIMPGRIKRPRGGSAIVQPGKVWAMRGFSLKSLIAEAFNAHQGWGRQWRDPEPKPAYDAVIVGGGGHGLATAYYLAKEHGMRNIAVLEKGWIGGGNTGRNTTIIRSNYMLDDNA